MSKSTTLKAALELMDICNEAPSECPLHDLNYSIYTSQVQHNRRYVENLTKFICLLTCNYMPIDTKTYTKTYNLAEQE